MILLKVTLLEGRSDAQKAELIQRLTEAASRHFSEPSAEIRVILYEVPPTNWGAGGVTIQQRERKQP